MPRTSDSGDPGHTSHIGAPDTAFRKENGVGITIRPISELITHGLLAVYASHPPVTRRMATLATGLPATALTGLDLHQLDSYKEFHCLITDSPFPRFPSAIPRWPT